MAGLWRCTHKSNRGEEKAVLHSGDQCTDVWNQWHDCALFKATWEFISCTAAASAPDRSDEQRGVPGERGDAGERGKAEEYPNQSEKDKCGLQIDKAGKLYCEPLGQCRGDCILYSVPFGQPNAEWKVEEPHCEPDASRYYFCRCLEL